jgi:hypothetical protein
MAAGADEEAQEERLEMAKLTRDVFLYMAPRGKNPAQSAQCGTCPMWNLDTGENANRCHIHGPKHEALAGDTCGIYVPGPPHKAKCMALVTPKESGFEKRQVRCENCRYSRQWSGGHRCKRFMDMNRLEPDVWDLDPEIEPLACCNANRPK